MNAKRSWVIWIIVCLIFGGAGWGFVHGAKLTDVDGLKGGLWMISSLAVIALTIFASYKWKLLKR